MLSELVACAKYEGAPLVALESEMNWKITFSSQEIAEMEKYLQIFAPLESLFSSLNSDKQSTIQKVYPSLKVSIRLLFAEYLYWSWNYFRLS